MKGIENKNLSGKDGFDLGFGGLRTGFGGMLFQNQEQRKNRMVGKRFGKDGDNLEIDTSFTPDTGFYETGIVDVRYSKDKCWIIIEEYKTKKEAEIKHKKWVRLLTGKKLPVSITDIHTGEEFQQI